MSGVYRRLSWSWWSWWYASLWSNNEKIWLPPMLSMTSWMSVWNCFFGSTFCNHNINGPILLLYSSLWEWVFTVQMDDLLFVNPLSTNPIKWSNTLKQFVGCCRRFLCVCLIILWGRRLKCLGDLQYSISFYCRVVLESSCYSVELVLGPSDWFSFVEFLHAQYLDHLRKQISSLFNCLTWSFWLC